MTTLRWFKLIGACVAGTVAVAGGTLGIYDHFLDKPRIVVNLSASPPLFRLTTNDTWTTDAYKPVMSEIIDVAFTEAVRSYLQSNKLISADAFTTLSKKKTA